MSVKLVPKFARVILKRAAEEKSKGGIIYVDSKRHSKPIGEVVAVGPTCDESIQVGMTVYLGKMAGAWINDIDDCNEYYICADEDVLAEIVKN